MKRGPFLMKSLALFILKQESEREKALFRKIKDLRLFVNRIVCQRFEHLRTQWIDWFTVGFHEMVLVKMLLRDAIKRPTNASSRKDPEDLAAVRVESLCSLYERYIPLLNQIGEFWAKVLIAFGKANDQLKISLDQQLACGIG